MRSSSDRPVLWISERQVSELMDMPTAVGIIRAAHAAYADGEAVNLPRSHASFDGALLTAVGGRAGSHAATKTWIHTPQGASPLLVVFSTRDGSVEGVIEAFGLGEFRTGATSGVATGVLAREDADVLALIGAGKQAVAQAQGVAAVRALREIRVFSRSDDRRRACVERLRDALEADVIACSSVSAAAAGAGIITTVTRAVEPIVTADLIDAGAHLNAVGSFVPHKRELAADAVGRCDIVVTDSIEQARHDSGELRAAVDAGVLSWDAVGELGPLVRRSSGRPVAARDVSLFKALGVGFADAALGSEILRRARELGVGHHVAPDRVGAAPTPKGGKSA